MDPRAYILLLTHKMKMPKEGLSFEATVASFQTEVLRKAIEMNGWNMAHTAKFLRLKRSTLAAKLNKAGILRPAHMKE